MSKMLNALRSALVSCQAARSSANGKGAAYRAAISTVDRLASHAGLAVSKRTQASQDFHICDTEIGNGFLVHDKFFDFVFHIRLVLEVNKKGRCRNWSVHTAYRFCPGPW